MTGGVFGITRAMMGPPPFFGLESEFAPKSSDQTRRVQRILRSGPLMTDDVEPFVVRWRLKIHGDRLEVRIRRPRSAER